VRPSRERSSINLFTQIGYRIPGVCSGFAA
jgi:hypothetical protein